MEEKMSEETIKSLEQLGEVLYSIAQRLVSEGKAKIVDGKIVFLEDENQSK